MEYYNRYRRIEENVTALELQELFNDLVKDGWQIIYYNEKEWITDTKSFDLNEVTTTKISVIMVVGKTASQIKNVL
jgi:hypothetical protein